MGALRSACSVIVHTAIRGPDYVRTQIKQDLFHWRVCLWLGRSCCQVAAAFRDWNGSVTPYACMVRDYTSHVDPHITERCFLLEGLIHSTAAQLQGIRISATSGVDTEYDCRKQQQMAEVHDLSKISERADGLHGHMRAGSASASVLQVHMHVQAEPLLCCRKKRQNSWQLLYGVRGSECDLVFSTVDEFSFLVPTKSCQQKSAECF